MIPGEFYIISKPNANVDGIPLPVGFVFRYNSKMVALKDFCQLCESKPFDLGLEEHFKKFIGQKMWLSEVVNLEGQTQEYLSECGVLKEYTIESISYTTNFERNDFEESLRFTFKETDKVFIKEIEYFKV